MCSVPGIPERLHMQSREIDESFSESENIFRRFKEVVKPEQWEDSSDLQASVFPLNNDSYNRGKYSIPADVLYNVNAQTEAEHFFKWGVLSINCSFLLEQEFEAEINKVNLIFTFQLKHSPIDCMYPHIELLIYRKDTKELAPSKPRPIKSAIRRFLLKNKEIIKQCEL